MPGDREKSDVALEATASAPVAVTDRTVASQAATLTGSGVHELPEVVPDRYIAGAEVGRGGIGRVVRARDQVLERPVAIKELFATDEASRRRFVRETLITARLQHPSIIPVYDAGRRDHSPFYAMKLVAGTPLDRALAAARTFADRLALLPTILAVADAMAYAHSERIIHRDLKPGNVLVGKFGETVVIDWGLAKDLSIDDLDALPAGPYRSDLDGQTVAGSVLGTPGYMAPEQAEGAEVDERTDVYALGAMLYHVISGALPHQGTTLEDVIAKVIRGDIRPLLEVEPQTPPDLAAIVGKAMATDKAARYRSAGQLADDLRRFQTGQLVGAHHYTTGQRVRRWVRRHRAISAVTAIATIVLVVFGTWSIRRILTATDDARSQRDVALAEQAKALENANRAVLNQARAALERDPALALALLATLDDRAPGWDAVRVLAADALSHPRLVHELRGPEALTYRSIAVTSDGRRALAHDGEGIWIIDLERGTAVQKPASYQRELEVCDDGKRAYGLVGEPGIQHLIELDLRTGEVTPRGPARKPRWVELVEQCNAARAVKASIAGLVWRDAAGAVIQLSTEPMESAWLAPDRKHVVALDRAGGLRRFAEGKEVGSIPGPAAIDPKIQPRIDPTSGWVSGPQASMSRDGSVAITVHGGRATYWTFTHGRAGILIGGAMPDGHAVEPDGTHAYVSARDRTWVIENAAEVVPQNDDDLPHGRLQISADGNWLVALKDRQATLLDLVGGGVRRLATAHKIDELAFLAGGRLLTAGDERIRTWELGGAAHALGSKAMAAAISPDGRWIAVGDDQTVARKPIDGQFETIARPPGRGSLAISSTGDVVFTVLEQVFSWPRGTTVHLIGAHLGAAGLSLRLLGDGTPVTASHDRVAVWTGGLPRYIRVPHVRARQATATLGVDQVGRRALVSCMPDGEVVRTCLVDLVAGKTTVLEGARGLFAIAGNGSVAITAGETDRYLIWDLDRGTPTSRKGVGEVTAVGVSRDGSRAAIGGRLGVDLIDLAPSSITALHSTARPSGSIMFSPSGRTIVDSSLRLWDVTSGESRKVTYGRSQAHHLGDDRLIAIGWDSSLVVRDDLPRAPGDLSKWLRDLPYKLDAHGSLIIEAR